MSVPRSRSLGQHYDQGPEQKQFCQRSFPATSLPPNPPEKLARRFEAGQYFFDSSSTDRLAAQPVPPGNLLCLCSEHLDGYLQS
jgi:hypothetical protein